MNRATVHHITENEVRLTHPEFIDEQGNLDTSDESILYRPALAILHQRNIFPQRGDIIYFDFLGGYRNQGKSIFDGQDIISLDYEQDDYGNVPEQFQAIIEFPPKYWSEIIEHNELVPFDYARHLKGMVPGNVYSIRLNNGNYVFTLPFKGPNGQVYIILDYMELSGNPLQHPRIIQFLHELTEAKYFEYVYNTEDLSQNLDPENILKLVSPP